MGFLPESEIVAKETARLSCCLACGLFRQCDSPRMQPTGEGERKILVIAEAPGREEDEKGTQLIGKAGKRLRRVLRGLDVDLDRDCWKTNAVCCRPKDNKMTDAYIDNCRPNLIMHVKRLNPEVIILLGASAVKSYLGQYWTKDIGAITRWVGWKIPLQVGPDPTWVHITYHPSYLERMEDPVLNLWFEKHLDDATAVGGRPIIQPQPQVEILVEPSAVAAWIRKKLASDKPISFDFETDRLKPDHPDARVVACSVCWAGKEVIAFPWVGEAITAMKELLQSDVPKYGWSIKFEQRWVMAKLRCRVKAWAWDGMQASHVLDNRQGITSLKFQAFVQFGILPWDLDVQPYLQASGGNQKNRIAQCDLMRLLQYCGMDALMEYRLARKQMIEMRILSNGE